MMEAIALSVVANWIYQFLVNVLPLAPESIIAHFANNQIALNESQALKLIEIVEEENLVANADQLSESDFIKKLEKNRNFHQFVESINQTNMNDESTNIFGDNNSVNTGTGDFLKDSSRKVETAGNYLEDNSVTNNYIATNDEKK